MSLQNTRIPDLRITHCIFEPGHMEVLVVDEGSGLGEQSIAGILSKKLEISDLSKIQVAKLVRPSTFMRTAGIFPGDPAIGTLGTGTIGAFVNVEGKGLHVLLAGHCNKIGHPVMTYEIGKVPEVIGIIQVQQTTDDEAHGSQDAALASLSSSFTNYFPDVQIVDTIIRLTPDPLLVNNGMLVQKFCKQKSPPTKGMTKYADYNSFQHNVYSCVAFLRADGQDAYFHTVGESGTLVTTDVPDKGFVQPIGILYATEFLERTMDGRGYKLSLAIPLTRSLQHLKQDNYCNEAHIQFQSGQLEE